MKTKSKVVKHLLSLYPALDWKAERNGWGWVYVASNGWTAYWVSCLAPRYDGDDDTFQSRFFIYKTNGQSPEQVFL